MIRVQLKKRFDTRSKAVRFLMSIVDHGDETYFEFVGKRKKGATEENADATLKNELSELGLKSGVDI